MLKSQAVAAAVVALPEVPTVFTTGFTARLVSAVGNRPNHLPLTGSMGLALPVGTGIALATGRTTLVLDGDGSLLMNPAGLLTLGTLPDAPVLHVVLDDGQYASTGGQPSPGDAVDPLGLAEASGVHEVHRAVTTAELTSLLRSRGHTSGPVFVHCPVEADPGPPAPRITTPLPELAARLTAWLSGTAHED